MFHSRTKTVATLTMLCATLFCTGCYKYKQPTADAPHATVIGTYLGGAPNEETGYVAFGYVPGVRVCKGKKGGKNCNKSATGPLDQRTFTFRIHTGREMTVTPAGLLDSRYTNDGMTTTYTETWCFGEPFTVTPAPGDVYSYAYEYDPNSSKCGSVWKKDDAAAK